MTEEYQNKIKAIIAFALQEAAQANRQLGVIHLLKYVYFVDLDYARHNDGKTYTDTDWEFYKFGPWSLLLYKLILSTLSIIGAKENRYQSNQYVEDCVRYQLRFDEHEYARIKKELGITIWGSLANHVSSHYDDTTALLNDVYSTKPMLRAAPHDKIDFSVVAKSSLEASPDNSSEYVPVMERMSKRKSKRFKEDMDLLRNKFRNKSRKLKSIPPRQEYDDVYQQGMEWLDSLAGEEFPKESVMTRVDGNLWESGVREQDE